MSTDWKFGARRAAATAMIAIGLTTVAAPAATQASVSPVHAAARQAARFVAASPFAVLHSFAGSDGSSPQGQLQDVLSYSHGKLTATLFGAAQFGGANGDGNIFAQSLWSAAFGDIFDFNGTNGATPTGGISGLINSYSTPGPLFGAVATGGAYGMGGLYVYVPGGATTLVYSFTGGADGANPAGHLVYANGVAFGTTQAGANGYGTVFTFSPTTGFKTIYTFGNGNDGGAPLAGLTYGYALASSAAGRSTTTRTGTGVSSVLYGTTSVGGNGGLGTGTIFKITPTGKLTTLYTFTDSTAQPGANPSAELVSDYLGNLYGTTANGGSGGIGEVFQFIPSTGKLNVIHDFAVDAATFSEPTGANPLSPVTIALNGDLYGTTSAGSANGLGNIFKINRSGVFSLIHEFAGSDGATPTGRLSTGSTATCTGRRARAARTVSGRSLKSASSGRAAWCAGLSLR